MKIFPALACPKTHAHRLVLRQALLRPAAWNGSDPSWSTPQKRALSCHRRRRRRRPSWRGWRRRRRRRQRRPRRQRGSRSCGRRISHQTSRDRCHRWPWRRLPRPHGRGAATSVRLEQRRVCRPARRRRARRRASGGPCGSPAPLSTDTPPLAPDPPGCRSAQPPPTREWTRRRLSPASTCSASPAAGCSEGRDRWGCWRRAWSVAAGRGVGSFAGAGAEAAMLHGDVVYF
jgi:hypothetical protein